MKKKAPAPVPVLVRVPPVLLRKLDASRTAQGRSRTSELCIRLADSFKREKAEAAA